MVCKCNVLGVVHLSVMPLDIVNCYLVSYNFNSLL